jgi:CheY-like chemotaxis protein
VFRAKQTEWESLIPKSVTKKLDAQRKAAQGGDMPEWHRDVLDFATLKQLIDVLAARWHLFEPPLSDKTKTSTHLDELREFRNRLAHGWDPDPNGKIETMVTIMKVASRIPDLPIPYRAAHTQTYALSGRQILWADDLPALTRLERRWLEELGANVVPVLSNDEAVRESKERTFDLVISDIDRGREEPGTRLPSRLAESGQRIPLIFYTGRIDPGVPPPAGAVGITNDPADLLHLALDVLRRRL